MFTFILGSLYAYYIVSTKLRKFVIINSNYKGGNESLKLRILPPLLHPSGTDRTEFIFDYGWFI